MSLKPSRKPGTAQLKKKETIGKWPSGRKSRVRLREEFGERLIERTYQTTEDLLGINGFSKLKEMERTEQG